MISVFTVMLPLLLRSNFFLKEILWLHSWQPMAFLPRVSSCVPVGGVLFGYFGDKYGRKNALILSIILMAVPTVSMGLLPTYDQIGLFAPALLTLMRLLQGLSLGGEYTGSVSYLVEHAPASKRGLFGSWATFAGIGGILLGSAVGALLTNTLSKQDIMEWGWRLPFLGRYFHRCHRRLYAARSA
jgi:MFS family permease